MLCSQSTGSRTEPRGGWGRRNLARVQLPPEGRNAREGITREGRQSLPAHTERDCSNNLLLEVLGGKGGKGRNKVNGRLLLLRGGCAIDDTRGWQTPYVNRARGHIQFCDAGHCTTLLARAIHRHLRAHVWQWPTLPLLLLLLLPPTRDGE